MSKATLTIHGSPEVKICVQYNPSEYSLAWGAKYASGNGMGKQGAEKEFVGETPGTLSFKLTIDGFTKANTDNENKAADVSEDIKKLKALLEVEEQDSDPPECTFEWGLLIFRGKVDSLNAHYTMFSSEGKPLRATIDISISQAKRGVKAKDDAVDTTKLQVVEQEKELSEVANDVYNDPAAWRPIAVANGIKNPRLMIVGMALVVPPLGG